MRTRNLWSAFVVSAGLLLSMSAFAQEKKEEKKTEPAKPAAAQPAPAPAKPADKPADKPAAPAAPAKAGDKPAAAPAGMPGMEMMMPGEGHAKMKALEGTWDALIKNSMDPSGATESKGTTTAKWIMDGRYLVEEHSAEMMGMPFKGMGISGYDNATKKYFNVWIDNMGTGVMNSTGSVDASGKVFTYEGESFDPMQGKNVKMRMITKIIDDKKHTFEMFAPGPDGKEAKILEITYTKK